MMIHKRLSRGSSLSREKLGNGPLRFAPVEKERGIKDQINALNPSERSCFDHLKQKWEKKYPDNDDAYSNEMLLRFLRCSPGEAFHERPAWKIMKAYPQRCHKLTAASLEHQLKTKTIFPIPSLRTGDGYEVCYMRPCRVLAKPAAVSMEMLDSIAYTLGTMMENERPCTNGISVMFNMDGFGMSNFATDYWFNLMSMLQGKIVPLRVNNLFIINPPSWFDNIWNLTKPMITLEFQAKVRMINEEELTYYLETGYEEFLPDEMETGQTSTQNLVEDYIAYRKAVEGSLQLSFSHPNNKKKNVDTTLNTISRRKVERRNSFAPLNVAAAAAATFETFVPKNPARRRNSICSSSSMCDETKSRAAGGSAAKPAQRRRNSIACSTPVGATTVAFPASTTTNKPLMQRRRNSLSSTTAHCPSSPKNRRNVSTGIFDFPKKRCDDDNNNTAVYDSPPTLKKPLMQRRRSSLSSSASPQGSCSSSPMMKSRRHLLSAVGTTGILDSSPTNKDSPNRRWDEISAVCDSPSMKRRNSVFSTVPITCGEYSPPTCSKGQEAKHHIKSERRGSYGSSFLAVPSLGINLFEEPACDP